jgi:hypothetical protein
LVRPKLEVADIFRRYGPAWRQANAGHVSLGQLKVMSAIENCRTAALGGHVARRLHADGGNVRHTPDTDVPHFPCQRATRLSWRAILAGKPAPSIPANRVTRTRALVWAATWCSHNSRSQNRGHARF